MARGNPTWKGYDVEKKMACVNWGYSGKKQIKIYKYAKKWGLDPQREFEKMMDELLNKLSNNEEQLAEMKNKVDYLKTQIELIEKNNGNSITINEKLLTDIDEHVDRMHDLTTDQWIYAIINKLRFRYDLSFNDMLKVIVERISQYKGSREYREKLLFRFRYVGERAKNGTLTDKEIEQVFPKPVRA